MSYSFLGDPSNESTINVRTVSRFKIFAVYQRRKRGGFVRAVAIDDGINTEMLLGDSFIGD